MGVRATLLAGRPEAGALSVARSMVLLPVEVQLLRRNQKRFRGGLIFQAHGLLFHSTLGREQ